MDTTAPSPSGGTATGNAIAIHNFAFQPGSFSVKVGTTVRWTNQDPSPTQHTATAGDKSFDTGPIPSGQSKTFTFMTPGTYQYHCNIHQYMTATITVTS